jgi:hypothetical protein
MRHHLPIWLVACSATLAGTSALLPASGEEITRERCTEPELRSELLALRDRDQELRSALIESPEDEARKEELRAFDERATARAKEILAEHGWPSVEEVGADGSGALWLLIQHSTDPDFLAEAVPLMEQAAERGDLDRASVALSVDRVRTNRGEPQLYGTQFHEVDGELVPYPIEDEARLDERRERMGLPPFEEYRRLLLEVYGRAPKEEEEPGTCSR